MATITTKIESKRGCGFRKKGGLYFICSGGGRSCCKLPFELKVCPTCNGGVHQTRSFQWITTDLVPGPCVSLSPYYDCVLGTPGKKAGLMWVGKKFYPTPEDFTKEAHRLGISKRISAVPTDFKVGEDWVFLAHPEAIAKWDTELGMELHPGIFYAFQPQRIEYVVKGTESEEELERLEKRGLSLVDVVPEQTLETA